MIRTLFRWLAALVASATCLSHAHAQAQGQPVPTVPEAGAPIAEFAVAALAAAAVLLVVCMPSRKEP